MFDFAERRRRLAEILEHEGVDAIFLGPDSDLEYLTGLERNIPTFGHVSYAHGWVTGAFLKAGAEPIFILPRMYAEFDLPHGVPGELIVVKETDDGRALFDQAARRLGRIKRLAIGSRPCGATGMNPIPGLRNPQLVSGQPVADRPRPAKAPGERGVSD